MADLNGRFGWLSRRFGSNGKGRRKRKKQTWEPEGSREVMSDSRDVERATGEEVK